MIILKEKNFFWDGGIFSKFKNFLGMRVTIRKEIKKDKILLFMYI